MCEIMGRLLEVIEAILKVIDDLKKIPERLKPLIEDGIIDEVIQPIMSGKEATVYLVRADGELRCAKVYKDVKQRSFQNSSMYREGRNERNSRKARAMAKRSSFGRREEEESWQNAEVEALYRLAAAGVRVPKAYGCFDGVLIMELIADESGGVAPRLSTVDMTDEVVHEYHQFLLVELIRMLCSGLVHGDLSEYNILVDANGPVIIDLPQAVDAAGNNNAKKIFIRDVNNLRVFFGRMVPEILSTNYGSEIWSIYERGELNPSVKLTGMFAADESEVDVDEVLDEIDEAREEALEKARFTKER
jgi:RIO kinase 1